MLNPDHATKATTIDRVLRRLGKRLTVTVYLLRDAHHAVCGEAA